MPVKGNHSLVRITVYVGQDSGLAFVAEVVQLVTKGLGIIWKLHMAYCP
jgi:hypothetical protein